jgi:hypothetical protein
MLVSLRPGRGSNFFSFSFFVGPPVLLEALIMSVCISLLLGMWVMVEHLPNLHKVLGLMANIGKK